VKALAANYGEGGSGTFDWIEQRLSSELRLDQSESAAQGKILEWSEVEHGRDCVGESSSFKKFQRPQPRARAERRGDMNAILPRRE